MRNIREGVFLTFDEIYDAMCRVGAKGRMLARGLERSDVFYSNKYIPRIYEIYEGFSRVYHFPWNMRNNLFVVSIVYPLWLESVLLIGCRVPLKLQEFSVGVPEVRGSSRGMQLTHVHRVQRTIPRLKKSLFAAPRSNRFPSRLSGSFGKFERNTPFWEG